jgi:hypothetical protein
VAAVIGLGFAALVLAQDAAPATMPARVMGTLVKVDGKNLVIDVRQKGQITLATDENTTFSVDLQPGKLTDLKPEMKLSVVPLAATARRPARLMVTASSKALSGTVLRIEGRKLVLQAAPSGAEGGEITVATDENTRFVSMVAVESGKAGRLQDGKLEDIKAGMHVQVTPETGTARRIMISPAARPTSGPVSGAASVSGTLLRVEGSNLILHRGAVQTADELVVDVGGNVEFLVDAEPGRFDDLKPQMSVMITSLPAPARLRVVANSPGLRGTVVKIDGTDLVIAVKQTAWTPGQAALSARTQEMTIGTDDTTKVIFLAPRLGPDKPGKPQIMRLHDLKPDMTVTVLLANGTASKIIAESGEHQVAR